MTALSLPVLAPAAPAMPPQQETTVGNYFVANYPPFGYWTQDAVTHFHNALNTPPRPGVEMGLYAHIPFCRKRCHFCYFRVYTDKNSKEIHRYLDAVIAEATTLAAKPIVGGRLPSFVYFGGGTPSYLSPDQLTRLVTALQRLMPWDRAREITIEAEPGTLNDSKLQRIRDLGFTRLSLGIEHFDDHILEINGRAHRSKEIHRAYDFARSIGIPEVNIDLIAGMLEETDSKWADAVDKTIALAPDTVTIYQMEIPYNTTIYQQMKAQGQLVAPVADWATKRRWVDEAFARFTGAGYTVTSATTVVKDPARHRFVYRNGLFNGSDLLSVGVSAFGHVGGVNYQNEHNFDPYIDAVAARGLATYRAYPLNAEENYIREFALQLKAGRVLAEPFARKFGVSPVEQFGPTLAMLAQRALLTVTDDAVTLTREGLLQVDRLLFEFFRPVHRHGRFA